MKQTKKLLALVLALVMTFSLMAVTAAAAGTEEHEHVCSTETVQPRKPGAICSSCGYPMREVSTQKDIYGNRYTHFECDNDDCTNPTTKDIYW